MHAFGCRHVLTWCAQRVQQRKISRPILEKIQGRIRILRCEGGVHFRGVEQCLDWKLRALVVQASCRELPAPGIRESTFGSEHSPQRIRLDHAFLRADTGKHVAHLYGYTERIE